MSPQNDNPQTVRDVVELIYGKIDNIDGKVDQACAALSEISTMIREFLAAVSDERAGTP